MRTADSTDGECSPSSVARCSRITRYPCVPRRTTTLSTDDNTDHDRRIVTNLAEAADLEIDVLDVGVADGVLAFDISGRIENVPDGQLDDLTGTTLEPSTLALTVADAP